MQTGILKQILVDDSGEILVVSDVLGEHHEGDWHIGNRYRRDVAAGKFFDALECRDEGEVRDREERHVMEHAEVDDLQGGVVGGVADDREDRRNQVAREDAQNEGDELHHFLAVGGAEHDSEQRHKTADQANIGACHGVAFCIQHFSERQIADGVACQRKTDDGNGGPDNDRRHQLVDPFDTGKFHDHGDHNIDKAGKECADQQSEVAELNARNRTGKRCQHGTDESERTAEEDGAAEFGEQQIDDGSHTGAEQRSGLLHAVADNGGHRDGRRQDRQQLLEGEDDQLPEFGLVVDTIGEFHVAIPPVLNCFL